MKAWLVKHKVAAIVAAVVVLLAILWWRLRRVVRVTTIDIPVIGTDAEFGTHTMDELNKIIADAMAGDGT